MFGNKCVRDSILATCIHYLPNSSSTTITILTQKVFKHLKWYINTKYRKIPVPNSFGPKNHFQPIKKERMSLKKESFTVALSLSVSLSHFSFVETCERKKTSKYEYSTTYIPNIIQYNYKQGWRVGLLKRISFVQ